MNCIIPDTSAVIIGAVSRIVEEENLDYPEIIVPEAVVCELEHQANSRLQKGEKGLEELHKLQEMQDEGILAVSFKGRRPSDYDIRHAKNGEIDSIIRDVARSELGTLLTADRIQAKTAAAQGIPFRYYQQEYVRGELPVEKYFDENTMSVHLKENVIPMAKKGKPGQVSFEAIEKNPQSYSELKEIALEIIDTAKNDEKTYMESDRKGSYIIQSREYRISIAYPPFSEALEITAVRPVADIELKDYNLSHKLIERIENRAEGILISGSPGAGKSTFVQAIGKHYSQNLNKIVKTMESPRDLQLPDEITQYGPLDNSMENTADVLLLVRPDYTIYDELRKNRDFSIFADMRLAGVGMIGVIHATRPIDAIQRISSRVELGVIPSIVDTSIFIEDGEVKSVYETRMTTKVPSGMKDADLARPVIEVRDFETGELKNEIYTYGEQTIVMDVDEGPQEDKRKDEKTPVEILAEKEISKKISKCLPKNVPYEVEVKSPYRADVYLPEYYVPKIIGTNGTRITGIEDDLGINLGIYILEYDPRNKFEVDILHTPTQLVLELGEKNGRKNFNIMIDDEYLLTATASKKGEVRIRRGNDLAECIMDTLERGGKITAIEK